MHCSASASPVGWRLLQMLAMLPVPSTPERAKGFRLEHASPAQEDKKPRCRVVHTVLKKKGKGTGAVAQGEKSLALAPAEEKGKGAGAVVVGVKSSALVSQTVQTATSLQDMNGNSQEPDSEEYTSPQDTPECSHYQYNSLREQWFALCDRMLAEGKEPMSFTRCRACMGLQWLQIVCGVM